MDVAFTEEDARRLARFCVNLTGSASNIGVALYPWVESRWRDLSASDWTTHAEHKFVRRGVFFSSENLWTIGSATTATKLVEVIHWSWTLPGRDTLLLVDLRSASPAQIADVFEDGLEDDPDNEVRMLDLTPNVLSRGEAGTCVRLFSSELDEESVRLLLHEL